MLSACIYIKERSDSRSHSLENPDSGLNVLSNDQLSTRHSCKETVARYQDYFIVWACINLGRIVHKCHYCEMVATAAANGISKI